MLIHVNSKFLFYNLNNYQNLISEENFKVKHTIIADDKYALENLQSKSGPYFVERLIEISEDDITALDFSGSENNFNEIKILNKAKIMQVFLKDYDNKIYKNIGQRFLEYLTKLPQTLINEIEKDLRLNLYSFIDIQNEANPEELFHASDQFFYRFGRFPGSNNLLVVPTGEIPYFVQSENIVLPIELYKKLQIRSGRGLVCVQFLAVLNIYLAGSTKDSQNIMSELFHNLSLQALSIEDDRIRITFDAMNKIHQIITDNSRTLKFEFMKNEIERSFDDDQKFQDTIVAMETTVNNVTKIDLIQTMLKDEKV